MNAEFHRLLLNGTNGGRMSIGEAIRLMKLSTADKDLRQTWLYFGDPSIKVT